MQTISFHSECGVNEGYSTENTTGVNIEDFGRKLQEIALKNQEETGIYISTVVSGPNRTVYNTEWGCPEGGEFTYSISAVANPAFTPSIDEWKKAALCFMNAVREEFQQSTVSIEFNDPNKTGIDFYYLNDDKALDVAIESINKDGEKIDISNIDWLDK